MTGNLGMTFDSDTVKPGGGEFEPMPEGIYTLLITSSEVKPNKAGTGKNLSLTMQVIDGAHKGRQVFDNIVLQNPSAKATEIGHGQLSALCRSCRKVIIGDSSELHGVPFQAKIKIKPADGQYAARNEVSYYVQPKNGSTIAPTKTSGDDDTIPF